MATATLTACAEEGTEDTEYTAVCIDQSTGERVQESDCPPEEFGNTSGSSPFLWYWLGRSSSAPPYGSKLSSGHGGTTVRPATGSVGFAPTRGGFGTRVSSAGG